MKLGSLFSGAGLGDLGWLMSGMDIRWQCEIDDYCQKVLELRFPETKKYRDVRGMINEELEPVDIVAGGFPCQPFSVAGKQRGDQDDRNLWPAMFEVVKKVRPAYVVGENVSGIIPLYLDTVLADLEGAGYSCRTFVFPAHALGASHRRERIWIVGYSEHNGRIAAEKRGCGETRNGSGETGQEQDGEFKRSGESTEDVANAGCERQAEHEKQAAGIKQCCEDVADTKGERLQGKCSERQENGKGKIQFGCRYRDAWREAESRVCRVTDGCSNRVDRLKALGNGQVMACSAFIGQLIMEFERLTNVGELQKGEC